MTVPGKIAAIAELPRRRAGKRCWLLLGMLLALATIAAGVWAEGRGATSPAASLEPRETESVSPRVEIIRPRKGGIERTTVQPGSVHSFETVELQSMVSGYLKDQRVDIGSRVKQGQVLAEIDVPRERQSAVEAVAMLDQAKAQTFQAEAKVKAMEAERDTAAATVAQTLADVDRVVANRKLAESQLTRVTYLHERKAVDQRLVDEQKRDQESTVAAEETARLAVMTAKARLAGTRAKIEEARSDVVEARAAVGVAQARVAKANVDLTYAKITAPFDGVITHRGFHPGSFIRSASDGSQPPLLTVSRTDLMRVVVRVPDRDVVLADAGDPAVVTIDGVEGRTFRGKIARIAGAEDPTSRTMRVEVDLPNPDGVLREGMYGRVSIGLEALSVRLTVPAACVIDHSGKDQGVVQIVREGKVQRLKVKLGAANGTLIEVQSGLSPEDDVVLRSSAPLEEGMAVVAKVSG